MKIAGVDPVATAKATFKQFREDDLQGSAAQVTYNVLFAVVPLLIFLTALSGFVARSFGVDDSMDRITSWLFDNMGTTQANAIREPIETIVTQNNSGLLSVGAVLALWGGKNAVAGLMKALNAAFSVEEGRPFIVRNLIAIGLTIALGLALTLASAIFLAGAAFATDAMEKVGLGDSWQRIWEYLRWPVIGLILIAVLTTLYWAAPNRRTQYFWLVPGSFLTVIGWGIITLGIGFYFTNFAGYAGGTYGVLGGVLVFIFWINLMVTTVLLGAELNSTLLGQRGVPIDEKVQANLSKAVASAKIVQMPAAGSGWTAITVPVPRSTVTQPVSSVPRGTSSTRWARQSEETQIAATPKASSKQSTWLLTLTMTFAKVILSGRRVMKRFSSSDRR